MIAKDIPSVEFHLPEPIAVFDFAMSDGAIVRVRRHGSICWAEAGPVAWQRVCDRCVFSILATLPGPIRGLRL
jgi:hypothetical protein